MAGVPSPIFAAFHLEVAIFLLHRTWPSVSVSREDNNFGILSEVLQNKSCLMGAHYTNIYLIKNMAKTSESAFEKLLIHENRKSSINFLNLS